MQKKASIIVILLFTLFLRVIALNQSFWLDEAVQGVLSLKPIFSVNYVADFQPPLFYVFTHFWLLLGNHSEWLLRLPSVFFGVASVYLVFYFIKKLFDEKTALISALLLATAPYHIYYSQEFRMYSFFSFLVLLSWILLWNKRWILYAITIGLASFTHYFVFIVVASQFVYMLFDRRIAIRQYVGILATAFVPFIFWLPTLYKQIQTAGSLVSVWPKWGEISTVSFLKFPFLFLAKTTVGMTSPANKIVYAGVVALSGIVFVIALYQIIVRTRQASSINLHKKSILLFCYFFIPLLIAWFSGLFIAANSPHRLTFVLPAFYALIAVGLERASKRVGPFLKKGPTLILAYLIIQNVYFSSTYLFNPKNHREDWQGAVSYTDSKLASGGIALSEFNGPFAPMEWYSKKPELYSGASTSMQITDESIKQKLDPLRSTLYTQPSTLILYAYLFQISDPQQLVEKYITNHKYKLVEEKDFRGVGIVKTFIKLSD